jgi:cold shock CspA family protein
MKGLVKKYITDKGFGFIRGESDKEYFFHRSNAEDQSALAEGVRVKFDIGENEKGNYAKNISVISIKQFIKIGKERMKMSNIKHYGVETYKEEKNDNIFERIDNASYEYSFLDKVNSFLTTPTVTIRYLYITTYQGDNYKFYDHEINLPQTVEELDAHFT